jgi:uncharacterized repeat protein (TIGR02543 family)
MAKKLAASRRVLALLLSLCMVLGVFVFAPVRALAAGTATVRNVTIEGHSEAQIIEQSVYVDLNGNTLGSGFTNGMPASTWFGSSLPNGINVSANGSPSGGENIFFIFTGTPSQEKTAQFTITIPKEVLADTSEDITVTANANAKFEIAAAYGEAATATIGDITIEGVKDAALPTNAYVTTITLSNDQLLSNIGNTPITDWFTGLPGGISVITANNTASQAGSSAFEIRFNGTPTEASTAVFGEGDLKITIPDTALTRGTAVVVAPNANAKFDIAASWGGEAAATIYGRTLNGIVDSSLSNGGLDLNLKNDRIKDTFFNVDAETWFTAWSGGLPEGLSATATGIAGQTTIYISISGTPKVTANANIGAIAIPGTFLSRGDEVTAPANDNAKFIIVAKETPVSYSANSDPAEKTFTAATQGYAAQAAQEFVIWNTGTGALTNVTAALNKGTESSDFEISTALSGTTANVNGSVTVSVSPKTGRSAGTYTDTLTINATGLDNPIEVSLSFTVNAEATPVTFTAVQTGGSLSTADSTGIKLTFSSSVTELTADKITITNGSTGDVTKGGLSGSGTEWTIALSDVTSAGTVSVGVANFGNFSVTTTAQPVSVYKDLTAPTLSTVSPTGNSVAASTNEIVLTFSEAMKTTGMSVALTYGSSQSVTLGSGTWTNDDKTYTIGITGALAYSTTYTIGLSGFKDASTAENAYTGDKTFITVAEGAQSAPTGLEGVAPTSAADGDGQITGVTTAMEYRLKTDSSYKAVTAVPITGLSAGTYEVRYAATGDKAASPVTEVTVPAYQAPSGTPVASVEITGGTTITTKGGTLQLGVTVEPSEATNKAVTWSSGNTAVATVDTNGLVTAVSNGSVEITATAQDGSNESDTHTVTVSGQDSTPVNPPSTPSSYYVTVIDSYANVTGEGYYDEGEMVTIRAGHRSGYSFDGWTSSDVNIRNSASVTANFTMPAYEVTVTANWIYRESGNNYSDDDDDDDDYEPYVEPKRSTFPGESTVAVEYTKTGDTITVVLPADKVNDLIDKAVDNTVTLDMSSVLGAETARLPVNALDRFADEGLNVDLALPGGSIRMDNAALKSILATANSGYLSVTLVPHNSPTLNDAQRAAIGPDDLVYEITLTGGAVIHEFNGAVTVTVEYDGPAPVSAWYMNSAGALEKVEGGSYDAASKTFSFNPPHLSLYVIGYDEAKTNSGLSGVSGNANDNPTTGGPQSNSPSANPLAWPFLIIPLAAVLGGGLYYLRKRRGNA